MVNKLDELLSHLGTGWWNVLHYIAMGYGMILPVCHALAGAFITPKVDFVCIAPATSGNQNSSRTHNLRSNITAEGFGFVSGHTNITQENQCTFFQEENADNEDLEEHACSDWVFDNSTFTNTLTSEFELVCDRNYLRAAYQSIYMSGVFVGALLSAILADKYGRKGVIIFGVIAFTSLGIASSWMTSLLAILFCRFLMGVIMPFMSNICYIMVVEISEARFRPHLGILAAIPWAVAVIVWGGLGYLIRNWRWLQFTVSMPGLLVLPLLWFTDESPRWLAVKGQHERVLRILKKAARWNGTVLPEDHETLAILKEAQDDEGPREVKQRSLNAREVIVSKMKNAAILFRTPKLRKNTCILYVAYLFVNFVYYGLSLNGGNLSDNPYLFMALSGAMEVPAYSLPVPIVSRFGRRVPGVICFLISGAVLLAITPLPSDYGWLIMTLAMVGKVTISMAFQILIFYSSELFPTEVRSRGIGTCFMVSRIGSIVSPFITEILGSSVPWAPSLVFGVTSVIAGGAMLTLPETLGIALPDTIAQLENRREKARKWRIFRTSERSFIN